MEFNNPQLNNQLVLLIQNNKSHIPSIILIIFVILFLNFLLILIILLFIDDIRLLLLILMPHCILLSETNLLWLYWNNAVLQRPSIPPILFVLYGCNRFLEGCINRLGYLFGSQGLLELSFLCFKWLKILICWCYIQDLVKLGNIELALQSG